MNTQKRTILSTSVVFLIGGLIAVSWFTFALLVPVGKILPTTLAVALVSLIEEVLKFSAVLALVPLIRIKPAQIPFLGIGFGLAEGIIHIIEDSPAPSAYHLKPFWAHIIFGLAMALFFYLAQKTNKPFVKGLFYILALIVPIVLHTSYNLIIRYII